MADSGLVRVVAVVQADAKDLTGLRHRRTEDGRGDQSSGRHGGAELIHARAARDGEQWRYGIREGRVARQLGEVVTAAVAFECRTYR